jgi:hypothetical protein
MGNEKMIMGDELGTGLEYIKILSQLFPYRDCEKS